MQHHVSNWGGGNAPVRREVVKMYFGNQKVNIEVAVLVNKENPLEASIKLNDEGTAFFQKYLANINKIQPDKNFTPEQA